MFNGMTWYIPIEVFGLVTCFFVFDCGINSIGMDDITCLVDAILR